MCNRVCVRGTWKVCAFAHVACVQILSRVCIPGGEGLHSGRALWGINRRQKDKKSPSLEKACGCVLKTKAGVEGFCSSGCSVWTGLKSQEGKTYKVFMKRGRCCFWPQLISSTLLLYVVYRVPRRSAAFRFPFYSLQYIPVSTGHYDMPVHYVMTGRELHQSLHNVVVFTLSDFVYQALYQEHWLDWNSSNWVQHKHNQAPRRSKRCLK